MFVFVNKKTGKVLGIEVYSNEGGEFCNSTGARFDAYSDTPFVGMDLEHMHQVMNKDTDWFNSSLTSPEHEGIKFTDYEIKSLKIVD